MGKKRMTWTFSRDENKIPYYKVNLPVYVNAKMFDKMVKRFGEAKVKRLLIMYFIESSGVGYEMFRSFHVLTDEEIDKVIDKFVESDKDGLILNTCDGDGEIDDFMSDLVKNRKGEE